MRPLTIRSLSALILLLVLALLWTQVSTASAETQTTTPTATTTAPVSSSTETTAPSPGATIPTNPTTTTTTAAPTEATSGRNGSPTAPQSELGEPGVAEHHVQRVTSGQDHVHRGIGRTKRSGAGSRRKGSAVVHGHTRKTGGASSEPEAVPGGRRAPSPKTITPALPLDLGGPLPGVNGFFVESFQIPPFLLPIYQAAGTAYGIPWQVLAAINEVETDYGRDLSLSSAGAEGWMQFLPSTWARYGVDATGAGYKDPYNPADAIFAAARYLRAAGGDTSIRAAVYAYNHSQAYVDSVMLRAQLLGGTPPELLGAVTGLTESEFPVHAPSHFSDGFQTLPAQGSVSARTLAGTTIYSQVGAPVIAVQDGEVTQIGESPALGRYVSLRDAYGNTYVYAELGSVATLYPVLEPREHTAVSSRIAPASGAAAKAEPTPTGPATAGAQPRSALSEGATVSGFALGAAASLEPAPALPTPAPAQSAVPRPVSSAPKPTGAHEFRSGPDDVYLHELRPGVQVLAGTVLGHIGAQATGSAEPTAMPSANSAATANATAATTATAGPAAQVAGEDASGQAREPHMFFQIKPAGAGAPLIDPKPILDGWVALENTSIFRARGENPFLATSPTVGQVLLESKQQLGQQVVRDSSIHMRACERASVQTGHVDKPVLAMLEYLSVSGLKPGVSGLGCATRVPASERNLAASAGQAVKIIAVNGVPIAGHQGPGQLADITIRKLLMLQGLNRPRQIVSDTNVPGATNIVVDSRAGDYIEVSFKPGGALGARTASAQISALSPSEWARLIARLGEIPDPTVSSGPSSAAIPDTTGSSEKEGVGNEGAGGGEAHGDG
jgi:hypothetical protein